MSRPLGSFNRRVNLPSHPEDSKPRGETRMARLRTENIPEERGGKTDSRNKGRSGPENRRFAGSVMNIDLSPGTPKQPYDTAQSLAPGQEGLVGELQSQASGRVYQKLNADLYKRTQHMNQTGQRVVSSTGLQAAFAPAFIGAAESRLSP
jgi:hypothetical protein